jgi:hypothetical protein
MDSKLAHQSKLATPKPAISLSQPGLLQRTCACGGIPGLTGECEECSSKRLSGPRVATRSAMPNNTPDDSSTQVQRTPLPGFSFGKIALKPQERLGMQAKLTIGQPNDRYEQEADRVANQVMRMPEPVRMTVRDFGRPPIQRLCPEGEEELQRQPKQPEEDEKKKKYLQKQPLAATITPLVQLQAKPPQTEDEEKKKRLQKKATSESSPEASPDLQERINGLQHGGQPLAESERAFVEPRFGYDFSGVRIHTDEQAAEMARSVNARAFTVGQDVVFGSGQYQPRSSEGQRLLAHELTHVVQQRHGGTYPPAPLHNSNLEREADRAASTFMDGGGLIRVAYGSAPGLARQPRSLSQSLNPSSLSDEELYQEINLIRQWLRDNPGSSPDHDQLMTAMQSLESEVWQRKEKQKPAQAPKSKESKSASQKSFGSVDITKLSDFELEQEYNTVQQRLISETSYPERQADEAYLQTIESEIEKRSKTGQKKPETKQITVLDYDSFSLPDGRMKSYESADALIHNWQQLEQVYIDANNGNLRAKQFVQDLEQTFAATGKYLAEHFYSAKCTLPVVRELSGECIPNWSYLDFLQKNKPGAVRLRQVLAETYEKRAKELQIRNEIIGHALNLLMAGIAVKSTLGTEVGAEIKEGLTIGESSGIVGEGKAVTTEAAGEGKAAVKGAANPSIMTSDQAQLLQKAKDFYPGHEGAIGVLRTESESSMFIKSGVEGGPWGGTQRGGIPRGEGYGFTKGGPSQGNIATHVEGHAAAIMWQRGIKRAVLIVDRPMCSICSRDLASALPPNSELVVISEEEGVTIVRSTHSY